MQALKRTDIKEQTIESQRQWLKNDRNACQNADCIKTAYETRIKELGLAYADDDEEKEDITRSLTMTCDYSDYGTYQTESVSITQTTNNQGKPAAIKKFKEVKTGTNVKHSLCVPASLPNASFHLEIVFA